MSKKVFLALSVQPVAKAASLPRPPAPTPFDAMLFMCHNDLSAPVPNKVFWYPLEYPLVCASG
jgi:hypothetical protein